MTASPYHFGDHARDHPDLLARRARSFRALRRDQRLEAENKVRTRPISPAKHRDQFEMRRPDELVDRHDPVEAKAAGDQPGGVAGEGRGIAGDGDHGVEREAASAAAWRAAPARGGSNTAAA